MLLFITFFVQAQTITPVESRCLNTGQIIVAGVIGSGAPYQLSLVSYPAAYTPDGIHSRSSLPDTFRSLYPGNYTLQVKDQSGTVWNYPNINVPGSYIVPGNNSYQPVATAVTSCALPNGKISGGMTAGRPPYNYTIIAGPAQVGVTNSSGNFTGLVAGNYQVQAADSCQNLQTRGITVGPYLGTPSFIINNTGIQKIACDSFSLNTIFTSPAIGAGYTYVVENTNAIPSPAVYTATDLPIRFKALRSDFQNGRLTIRVLDSCGGSRSYVPTAFNPLEFTADVEASCIGVVIDTIRFSAGFIAPYTVQVKATFDGTNGNTDSTTTQLITSLPYNVQGIPPNVHGLATYITITDACGVVLRQTNQLSFSLNQDSLQYSNCIDTKVKLSVSGIFRSPISYAVLPNGGEPANSTGNFVLRDGTYRFVATDSCGRTDTLGPVTIDRGWKITRAGQFKSCTPGFLTNWIDVPSRSVGQLNLRQYAGGRPLSAGSVLLARRTYTTSLNNCASCIPEASTAFRISFDSTLPGATYTYVLEDACGTTDTVTIINDTITYRQFFHRTTVKNKCINQGDVIASWDNDGPPGGTVSVEFYNNNNLFFTFRGGNSNLAAYPNGQTLLFDYPPGLYQVKYRLSTCDVVYTDTVRIRVYEQPVVSSVQSVQACTGTNFPIIINGANGVEPYTYQVVGSFPDNYTTTAQSSAIVNLPGPQTTITVRVQDACLNAATRTVAITPATPPFIRSNPSVFAACTLPFNFSLLTDSIYAGSVFEWTKLTGIGAGATVVGTRPSLPLRYNSIADTGTYQVRVRVPGSCYDMRSNYVVGAVAISCQPGVSGTVFNDANGLNDNLVNGVGTTAGTLYVSLIDSTNKTIAVSTVAANGTYFFLDVARGRYTAVLGTTAGVINAIAPLPQLPAGWVNTGEHLGSTAGSDGLVNGILNAIVVGTASVSQANFGIDQRPVANDVTAPVQSNPGGSNTVQVPALNGADAEDGTYDGVSGINTIVIQSLPVNAVLYYNGVAVVAGQVIQNYRPSLLRIDPVDGTVTVTFTYSEVDAALVMSAPALVTLVFRNFPQANVDSAFTPPGAPVVIAVLGNDDFGGDGPAATDITITATPLHGTAVVNNGGTTRNPVDDQILYTPVNGYVGNDTLIYQICDSNGDCDTALVIIYIGAPVPVTLSNFTATPSGAEVLLGWTVQTAVNVKEYVVMHSTDGIHYSAIGSKAAAGTGQYQLRHEHPKVGMNYYQLKTVDVDGKLSYSKILAVKFTPSAMHASVWPNPFADRIQLLVQLEQAGRIQVSLYDATGRVVRNESFNGVKGKNQFVLNDLQWLPRSIYILQLTSGEVSTQYKLVK